MSCLAERIIFQRKKVSEVKHNNMASNYIELSDSSSGEEDVADSVNIVKREVVNNVDKKSVNIENNLDNVNIIKIEDADEQDQPCTSSSSGNEDWENAGVILNIILVNPRDFECKSKPMAVRVNKAFTLDERNVSIESAKVDDNGAYVYKGCAKKFYQWMQDEERPQRIAHKVGNYWVVKERTGPNTYEDIKIEESTVYEVKRTYRQNKMNPWLSHCISQVRKVTESAYHNYYLVVYKVTGDYSAEDFKMVRHGNAKNPHSSIYYRQDQMLKEKIDAKLKSGWSNDKIYVTLTDETEDSLSTTIKSPTIIENRKKLLKKTLIESGKTEDERKQLSELEQMISYVKDPNAFSKSLHVDREQYCSINYTKEQLFDVYRFCACNNGILSVDTTFEVCDGLFLTDTTYTNLSLIDINGNHPEFPGPSFWHFRKTRETYRRFAGEMVLAEPLLLGVKKIGHDLDKAIAKGMKDIFNSAESLWCTRHLETNDAEKLRQLGVNETNKARILADIYGTQGQHLLENGLADAESEDDLRAKLLSLKPVWDRIIPGFYDWFLNWRLQIFVDCLTSEAREKLGISKRFTTNGLELKHRLQKKTLNENEVPKEIIAVSNSLQDWVANYFKEARRAIRGIGKYRLAPEYTNFFVEPALWIQWDDDRRDQHFNAFMNHFPSAFDGFQKPKSAGKKPSNSNGQKRTRIPEPELFRDRCSDPVQPKSGRVQENEDNCEAGTNVNEDISYLNPDRQQIGKLILVCREDKSLCPKSVKRCELCRIAFNSADVMLVKTVGVREVTDKNGVRRKVPGNVYLHYLTKCLKEYISNFNFTMIFVPKSTQNHIPAGGRDALKKLGLHFED